MTNDDHFHHSQPWGTRRRGSRARETGIRLSTNGDELVTGVVQGFGGFGFPWRREERGGERE